MKRHHPGKPILSDKEHEQVMLDVLTLLSTHGPVLGGPVGSAKKWRPATVRLWALLHPEDAPWGTAQGEVNYLGLMNAIHQLLFEGWIGCNREIGGQTEFTKIWVL